MFRLLRLRRFLRLRRRLLRLRRRLLRLRRFLRLRRRLLRRRLRHWLHHRLRRGSHGGSRYALVGVFATLVLGAWLHRGRLRLSRLRLRGGARGHRRRASDAPLDAVLVADARRTSRPALLVADGFVLVIRLTKATSGVSQATQTAALLADWIVHGVQQLCVAHVEIARARRRSEILCDSNNARRFALTSDGRRLVVRPGVGEYVWRAVHGGFSRRRRQRRRRRRRQCRRGRRCRGRRRRRRRLHPRAAFGEPVVLAHAAIARRDFRLVRHRALLLSSDDFAKSASSRTDASDATDVARWIDDLEIG